MARHTVIVVDSQLDPSETEIMQPGQTLVLITEGNVITSVRMPPFNPDVPAVESHVKPRAGVRVSPVKQSESK